MKPRAVLLDFDGVVAASLPVHLEAWDVAARTVFKRPLTNPESLVGRGTRAIAGLIATEMGDRSLASSLVIAKETWLAASFDKVPLMAGARDVVAELARRRLPHGIASNSPGPFVRGVLRAARLDVAYVVTKDEVARGKPHPDIYWELANRLRLDPSERGQILVFEDSAHGLKAALAAGMVGVGVASEVDAAKLKDAGAAAVCADLADALARGWLDDFL